MARTIIFGDVHGCHEELAELLALLEIAPGDRVISVGDLLNRGPDSHAVFDLVRAHNIECILGNHELRLLRYRRTKDTALLKDYDYPTLETLTEEDWAIIEGMQKLIELPELKTIIVHGGFLPNQPWQRQGVDLITRIQVIDRNGQPGKRSEMPDAKPWADFWQGPPFVVYGHTPRPGILRRRWSLGIDTACVYGGHLTAVILPEKRIVRVPAHRTYARSRTLPQPIPQDSRG
ncbi:MAG: metallophosphoesterase [Verrucomicrobiota bacterium]